MVDKYFFLIFPSLNMRHLVETRDGTYNALLAFARSAITSQDP